MNPGLTLGLATLCAFTGPGITKTRDRGLFSPRPYAATELRFANGTVVPLSSTPRPPSSSTRYYIIHLAQPVRQTLLSHLRGEGLEPVAYIAYQNLVVRCTRPDALEHLARNIPEVTWYGPFLPEYKIEDRTWSMGHRADSQSAIPHSLSVALWPGEKKPANAAQLSAWELAQLDEVAWVQSRGPAEPFNSDVQWVVQVGWDSVGPPVQNRDFRRFWSAGLRGQGMFVGLFDSGINTEHDMFRDPWVPLEAPGIYPEHRKIVAYKLFRTAAFGDPSAAAYHGSAVAGTLAGNDSVCGNLSPLDGVAPDARIYFLDIATASGQYLYDDDLTEMLDSIRLSYGMPEPVRQVSGSFGTMDYTGYYRLAEATLDAVTWQDKRFLVIWAAGNGGGTQFRIGHPACAKNCLTVGGCGNGVMSNLFYSLSSAGPTRDYRIKPNVLAPADSIFTVYGAGINSFRAREGTSFAAPAASGALTLLRQYLKEGWFPTGTPAPHRSYDAPTSALMRALAILSGDTNVGAGVVPDNRIGWGRLNLSRIMHLPDDSLALTFVDETVGLATGEFDEYELRLDRREPLHVVLAWTDTAASPAAEIALVNDLNLEVISPDGNRYLGNQFYNGSSIPNPTLEDERNVEEVVRIRNPLTGCWRIRVYARNVFTARQPYALAVRAGIEGLPPAIEERTGRTSVFLPPTLTTVKSGFRDLPPNATLRIWSADGRAVPLGHHSLPRAGVFFYELMLKNRTRIKGKLVVIK